MQGERPPHPGSILKERFLDPLGVAPATLAASLGISARRVREILRGRRGISTDTAIRLGLYFDVPPAWWLDMQARYDTEGAPLIDTLRRRVRPYEDLDRVLVSPAGVRHMQPPSGQEPRTTMVRVPADLLERLRAQAALDEPRRPRHVRTVTYASGATALVGSDDEQDR